jgi:hypothetical protein
LTAIAVYSVPDGGNVSAHFELRRSTALRLLMGQHSPAQSSDFSGRPEDCLNSIPHIVETLPRVSFKQKTGLHLPLHLQINSDLSVAEYGDQQRVLTD